MVISAKNEINVREDNPDDDKNVISKVVTWFSQEAYCAACLR